jgi:hypothetical protein
MNQSGYIALLITIIISSLLLISISAIGAGAVLHRLNIAATEEGVQSSYLANACGYYALVQLAYDKSYSGNENLTIAGNTCTIDPIPPPSNENISFTTWAEINKHKTHDAITIDSQLNIASWTEE